MLLPSSVAVYQALDTADASSEHDRSFGDDNGSLSVRVASNRANTDENRASSAVDPVNDSWDREHGLLDTDDSGSRRLLR